MRPLTLAAVVAVTLPLAVADAEPRQIAAYPASGGFIDDPFVLSADGKALAYLVTDGATKTTLHLVRPGETTPEVTFPYASVTPERIELLGGERLLVVERDPLTRLARGTIFGPQGASRDKLGPADGIALATVDGTPAIVTYLKVQKGSATSHSFAAVRRDNLKPLAKRVYAQGKDGRIVVAGKPGQVLYFRRGFTEVVVKQEGDFDKGRDIRKPDVEARLEVFSGKQLAARVIEDVIPWAQRVELHKKHPNEEAFVLYSEDLKHLQLVDGSDQLRELATPLPLRKYDHTALAYQRDGDGLLVSLTIDPVNPDAVAAQKADRDDLFLFRLDPAVGQLEPLARLDGKKRPAAWHLAGGRLAVLRKHKGFSRGGMELEVWDLAPTAPTKDGAPLPAPARN